jgi:hypothetical protein
MPSLVGFNRKLVILNKVKDIESELLDSIKDSIVIINGELLSADFSNRIRIEYLHKIMKQEQERNINIIIMKSSDCNIDAISLDMCGILEKLPLAE